MTNSLIPKIVLPGIRLPSVPALSVTPNIPVTFVTAGLSLVNSVLDCISRLGMAIIQDRDSERKFQLAMSEIDERKNKIKSDLITVEKKMEHIADASIQCLSLIRLSMEILAETAARETDSDRQAALIKELGNLSQQAISLTLECMKKIENCSMSAKPTGGE